MTGFLICLSVTAIWVGMCAALMRVLNTGFVTYRPRPGGRHAR